MEGLKSFENIEKFPNSSYVAAPEKKFSIEKTFPNEKILSNVICSPQNLWEKGNVSISSCH